VPEIRIANMKSGLLKYPTIRIDRVTFLGNPFILNKDGTRKEVIEKYKQWFDQQMLTNETFKQAFYNIAKRYAHYDIIQLACWCSPLECHGSIIKQALEEIYRKSNDNNPV